MRESPPQVHGVSRARLASVMRAALRSTTARMLDWTWQPLPYHAVLLDRTLARVTGSALLDDDRPIQWSSVLKLFSPAAMAEGRRGWHEVLAYRSSMLADLPGRLRAPRVLGIDEDDDGSVWLWLEDVSDVYGRDWPLAQFGVAARHLGVFNGAYLVSRALPTEPWLARSQTGHSTGPHPVPAALADLMQTVEHAAAQRIFGGTIWARVAHLMHDQPRFVRIRAELPQTLCHHDTSLANLFAARGPDGQLDTVAIDWEQPGPGPIGKDAAILVFGTMRRCELDAERAIELEQVVFDGYVDGLREAGWTGSSGHVRLGYLVSLPWSFLANALREVLAGSPHMQHPSQGWHVSTDAAIRQWIRLIEFLLDRAEEARRLPAS